MSIENYISENQSIINKIEGIRGRTKRRRFITVTILLILVLTPIILTKYVSIELAISFLAYFFIIPIFFYEIRNNTTPEDYEITADFLLIKHVWNKKYRIRKPREQFHEGPSPFFKFVLPSELFYDLDEDLKRRYEERNFYGAKINKVDFQAICMKYGSSEMDDHGHVDMGEEIGEFDFIRLQKESWDLKKCFIVPSSEKGFHRKELYGFQKEVTPTPKNIASTFRMYTNNTADLKLYLELYNIIQNFVIFKNRNEFRLVFKEDSIMMAFKRTKTPPFSPSVKRSLKDGQEIRRIDNAFQSLKETISDLDTLIKKGVPQAGTTPSTQTS